MEGGLLRFSVGVPKATRLEGENRAFDSFIVAGKAAMAG